MPPHRSRVLPCAAALLSPVLAALALWFIVSPAVAETVVLSPSQDTTIFSESGSRSNGAGRFLFVGKTLGRQATDLRRALVQFDLSVIPQDATLNSVELKLTKDRGAAGSVSVHRLTKDWGEAGSDAGSPGGMGAPAQEGDATWTQNRFGQSSWDVPGGDFVGTVSASANGTGLYSWQGDGIIADVAEWMGQPSVNFGWVLIGDETAGGAGAAKRFVSPSLTIDFTPGVMPIEHQLTMDVSPPDAGRASGGGTFAEGTNAVIGASPNPGFAFAGWLGEGVADPGSASTTVSMSADRTVTAQFTRIERNLTVLAEPVEGGTVSGGGTFADGTDAALTASPVAGFAFAGWLGEGVADPGSASTTVSMGADRTVTAQFTRIQRNLTVLAEPTEGGTVSGGGTFADGTDAALTASPVAGFAFAGWLGEGVADPGSASTTVSMGADRTVTAQFTRIERNLTVLAEPTEGGTVSGGGTFADGTDAALTASPVAGFAFAGWLGEGVADPGSASTTVSMGADRTVTAQFTRIQRILTVRAEPTEGGTVSGGGTFADGTDAALTASPVAGFAFAGWLGEGVADPGSASTTVSMGADRTVTAQFTRIQRNLTVLAEPTEGGTVSGGGTFADGTDAALTASPVAGFAFAGWLGEGVADPGSASTTVSMSADRTVTAQFTRIQRNLTVLAEPTEGGTVSGGGTFADGTDAALTASPVAGFAFAGWVGEGVADPGSASTTVSMGADRTVTAQFTRVWELTLAVDPPGAGTVSGAGTFADGTEASVRAQSADGFRFVRWTGVGVAVDDAPDTTVAMTVDRSVTALFEPVSADADADGLNDSWERDNGLDPSDASDAASDSDRDGRTALEEFLARTDPNDSSSFLAILEVRSISAGRMEIVWSSVSGVRYRLDTSAVLSAESWEALSEVVAEGRATSAEVAGAGSRLFVRVSVSRAIDDAD